MKYVRTPRHVVIADSWEFARQQASGRLIIMLSDDDALVSITLETFAEEASRHDADFVFSGVARYRDRSFPGPTQNTMDAQPSRDVALVSVEEFVRPLFLFRRAFDMHPSRVFEGSCRPHPPSDRSLLLDQRRRVFCMADDRGLRETIVFVDAPDDSRANQEILGFQHGLVNPGKEQIQAFIDDIDHERKHAPLRNFTTSNLMAEGMLTAKSLFPHEFADYEFDEAAYLRSTIKELISRRSMGVDVREAIDDALAYAAKDPSALEDLRRLGIGVTGCDARGAEAAAWYRRQSRRTRGAEACGGAPARGKLEAGTARSGFCNGGTTSASATSWAAPNFSAPRCLVTVADDGSMRAPPGRHRALELCLAQGCRDIQREASTSGGGVTRCG